MYVRPAAAASAPVFASRHYRHEFYEFLNAKKQGKIRVWQFRLQGYAAHREISGRKSDE